MSYFRKTSRALLGAAGILLLLIALAFLTLYVIDADQLLHSKQQLPKSKDQWAKAGITHYQIHVELTWIFSILGYSDPNIYLCSFNQDTLTIQNNKVIAARELSRCGNIYDQLTVDGAFALAEAHLGSQEPAIQILQFDSTYGYISSLVLTPSSGGESTSLRYSDLVVLDK